MTNPGRSALHAITKGNKTAIQAPDSI